MTSTPSDRKSTQVHAFALLALLALGWGYLQTGKTSQAGEAPAAAQLSRAAQPSRTLEDRVVPREEIGDDDDEDEDQSQPENAEQQRPLLEPLITA